MFRYTFTNRKVFILVSSCIQELTINIEEKNTMTDQPITTEEGETDLIRINISAKRELEALKVHPRQSFAEVVDELIKRDKEEAQ